MCDFHFAVNDEVNLMPHRGYLQPYVGSRPCRGPDTQHIHKVFTFLEVRDGEDVGKNLLWIWLVSILGPSTQNVNASYS